MLYESLETLWKTYLGTSGAESDSGNMQSVGRGKPMNSANCNMFTLYVTAANREAAVNSLVAALSGGCFCPFEITVLDVDRDPNILEYEHIASTPALVREWPAPRAMICGDLTTQETVRNFLHCGC